MSFTQRLDIEECEDFVVFEELKRRNFACDSIVKVVSISKVPVPRPLAPSAKTVPLTILQKIQAAAILLISHCCCENVDRVIMKANCTEYSDNVARCGEHCRAIWRVRSGASLSFT
jgi:hypothetical protein